MKIKGVIDDLKIKKLKIKKMIIVKIYLGLSLELLWIVWVSSFSDSSLIWLTLLKIYRPLPVYSVLTAGF